jgi:hypothetical protein
VKNITVKPGDVNVAYIEQIASPAILEEGSESSFQFHKDIGKRGLPAAGYTAGINAVGFKLTYNHVSIPVISDNADSADFQRGIKDCQINACVADAPAGAMVNALNFDKFAPPRQPPYSFNMVNQHAPRDHNIIFSLHNNIRPLLLIFDVLSILCANTNLRHFYYRPK